MTEPSSAANNGALRELSTPAPPGAPASNSPHQLAGTNINLPVTASAATHGSSVPQALIDKATERSATYRRIARAHYLAADSYAIKNRWLFGIPVILITTAVGSAIFSSLVAAAEPWMKVVAGLASLAGTLLSSLQTFLGYAQTAEKHKAAGEAYRAIRRRYEILALRLRDVSGETDATAIEALEKLEVLLAETAVQHPAPPERFFERARANK